MNKGLQNLIEMCMMFQYTVFEIIAKDKSVYPAIRLKSGCHNLIKEAMKREYHVSVSIEHGVTITNMKDGANR